MLFTPDKIIKESLITRTGYTWFLLVNIVFALYLIVRYFLSEFTDSRPRGMLWLSSLVLGFSLCNLALVALNKRHGLFIKRPFLPIMALLYGMQWASLFHTLYIADASNESIILLSVLIVFSAAIAFHLSPLLIAAVTLPVTAIVTYEIIIMDMSGNMLTLTSYALTMLVVLSARYVLMEWYRKAEHREHQNALLIQRLTLLADRDSLTGLANKRYFREYFYTITAQPSAHLTSACLVMIDVDFFKNYNDLNGHLSGDQCLIKVAQCIKTSIRNESDLVVRFGGEEFAVLLLSTDQNGVTSVCKRIQQNLLEAAIPHAASSASHFVTLSMGAATLHAGQTLDELIVAADQQLYRAKNNGRNRFHFAHD